MAIHSLSDLSAQLHVIKHEKPSERLIVLLSSSSLQIHLKLATSVDVPTAPTKPSGAVHSADFYRSD